MTFYSVLQRFRRILFASTVYRVALFLYGNFTQNHQECRPPCTLFFLVSILFRYLQLNWIFEPQNHSKNCHQKMPQKIVWLLKICYININFICIQCNEILCYFCILNALVETWQLNVLTCLIDYPNTGVFFTSTH